MCSWRKGRRGVEGEVFCRKGGERIFGKKGEKGKDGIVRVRGRGEGEYEGKSVRVYRWWGGWKGV